jgi:phosphoglycerol transferase
LFAEIADKYAKDFLSVYQASSAALGIIGSIGFIILIIWVFLNLFNKHSIRRNETATRIDQISALNLSALLLGTMGGLGTIVAFFILPQIRGYGRISVFIAFFSITAFMLLVDLLIQRYSFSKIRKWTIYGCTVIILFFGIYDQTSATTYYFVPTYKDTKEQFLNDKRFVNNIETIFPDDTMVFQLPYEFFPEAPPTFRMNGYDHIRAYLHSKIIHWSYGANKGRDGDLFQKSVAQKPTADMIQDLSLAGFNGIYLDSYGYKDSGKEIISSISALLNQTPLVSDNKRLYYFDMAPYNSRLKAQFTAEEFEKQK